MASPTSAPSATSVTIIQVEECVAISNTVSGDATLVVMSPVPTSEASRSDVVCFQDFFPATAIQTQSLQTFTIPDASAPIQTDDSPTDTTSSSASGDFPAGTAAALSSGGKHSNMTGPIVGSIVGALALAVILGAIIIFQKRRRQRAQAKHQWARAPNKWAFNDRKLSDGPQELDKVTSPTTLGPNV